MYLSALYKAMQKYRGKYPCRLYTGQGTEFCISPGIKLFALGIPITLPYDKKNYSTVCAFQGAFWWCIFHLKPMLCSGGITETVEVLHYPGHDSTLKWH